MRRAPFTRSKSDPKLARALLVCLVHVNYHGVEVAPNMWRYALTVRELAARLGRSPREVAAAVRSLHTFGLVDVARYNGTRYYPTRAADRAVELMEL